VFLLLENQVFNKTLQPEDEPRGLLKARVLAEFGPQ
jgi:hypothetical protein